MLVSWPRVAVALEVIYAIVVPRRLDVQFIGQVQTDTFYE